MFDPVTATIGAAVVGGGLSYLGAKEQAEGIGKAGKAAARSEARALEFQREIYEEGAPYRELGREAVPFLREDILAAEPGTSPLYQRALTGGIEDIQTQLAGYGLADSSVAGKAIGEFTGELSARDIADIRSRRMSLAGFQGAGTAGALQAGGAAAGAAREGGRLDVAGGAVRGGLYGSLGQTIAAAPLQYAQLSTLNKAPLYSGLAGGAQSPYFTEQVGAYGPVAQPGKAPTY